MERHKDYANREDSPESQKAIQLLREIEAGPVISDGALARTRLQQSFEEYDEQMHEKHNSELEAKSAYEKQQAENTEIERQLARKIRDRINETYLTLDKLLSFVDDYGHGEFPRTNVNIYDNTTRISSFEAESDPDKMTLIFRYDSERRLYVDLKKGEEFGIECRLESDKIEKSKPDDNYIVRGFLGGITGFAVSILHAITRIASGYNPEVTGYDLYIGTTLGTNIGLYGEHWYSQIKDWIKQKSNLSKFELKNLPEEEREKMLPIINELPKYVEAAVQFNLDVQKKLADAKPAPAEIVLERAKYKKQKALQIDELVS